MSRLLCLTLVALCFFSGVQCVFRPFGWTIGSTISQKLLTKWGAHSESRVMVVSGGVANIFDTIKSCSTLGQDKPNVDPWECANSALASFTSFMLAAARYQSTGIWYKRGTAAIDDLLATIPEDIKITDIKLNGELLPYNSSSTSLRRRELHQNGTEPINVYYNGSLPLSFVLHHDLSTTKNATSNSSGTVPLFVATDGRNFSVNHVALLTTEQQSSLEKRYGINGYTHYGAGGLKGQANSDPVATWTDVQNWLDYAHENSPGFYITYWSRWSIWLGHAFTQYVLNQDGYGLDGQFVLLGESVPFNGDWEVGWNYCFGPYPTNCN